MRPRNLATLFAAFALLAIPGSATAESITSNPPAGQALIAGGSHAGMIQWRLNEPADGACDLLLSRRGGPGIWTANPTIANNIPCAEARTLGGAMTPSGVAAVFTHANSGGVYTSTVYRQATPGGAWDAPVAVDGRIVSITANAAGSLAATIDAINSMPGVIRTRVRLAGGVWQAAETVATSRTAHGYTRPTSNGFEFAYTANVAFGPNWRDIHHRTRTDAGVWTADAVGGANAYSLGLWEPTNFPALPPITGSQDVGFFQDSELDIAPDGSVSALQYYSHENSGQLASHQLTTRTAGGAYFTTELKGPANAPYLYRGQFIRTPSGLRVLLANSVDYNTSALRIMAYAETAPGVWDRYPRELAPGRIQAAEAKITEIDPQPFTMREPHRSMVVLDTGEIIIGENQVSVYRTREFTSPAEILALPSAAAVATPTPAPEPFIPQPLPSLNPTTSLPAPPPITPPIPDSPDPLRLDVDRPVFGKVAAGASGRKLIGFGAGREVNVKILAVKLVNAPEISVAETGSCAAKTISAGTAGRPATGCAMTLIWNARRGESGPSQLGTLRVETSSATRPVIEYPITGTRLIVALAKPATATGRVPAPTTIATAIRTGKVIVPVKLTQPGVQARATLVINAKLAKLLGLATNGSKPVVIGSAPARTTAAFGSAQTPITITLNPAGKAAMKAAKAQKLAKVAAVAQVSVREKPGSKWLTGNVAAPIGGGATATPGKG